MHEDPTVLDLHAEHGNLLREGRRRTTVLDLVLEPVPRTGEASVDEPAFTQRTILVLADTRHRRNALAGNPDHRNPIRTRDPFFEVRYLASIPPSITNPAIAVPLTLPKSSEKVQPGRADHPDSREKRVDGMRFAL